ncbi:hypothetical protein ACIQYL_00440 [Lysinibacillus xylanilyticus]|uniref:hypothetical protein n=1 Tax=Lysinibacillus xylanilyticus TaxID=582475 RepID=UPI00381C2E1D
MKVIGTRSGKFKLKKKDIHINAHKRLTDVTLNNLKDLHLEKFPVVNDFEVLINNKDYKRRGKLISLYSASRNEQLTTFPCWHFAEAFLKDWSSSTIPTGTIEDPFYDIRKGWQIFIFEYKGYIYILQGNEFKKKIKTIHTWYRTAKEGYFKEWNKLVKQYKGKDIKVIGTKSGEFYFKEIDTKIHINKNEKLTNVCTNNTINLKELNLEKFPIVYDFEILITKKRLSKGFGKHIYFYSACRHEELGSFPYLDHAETYLKEWRIRDIPSGTIKYPFKDLEQGWQIFIFEHKDYIYILEGGEYHLKKNKIEKWYRTPKKDYFKQWKKLLKAFK